MQAAFRWHSLLWIEGFAVLPALHDRQEMVKQSGFVCSQALTLNIQWKVQKQLVNTQL